MVKLHDPYKLENHSLRIRIHQLKKRVLLRKFGYLFLRKTISNVLPSIASNFYLRIVLNKAFKKLVMNWYVERIEWKHNLRAELHYNFVLKRKTFKRFAIFYVKKKTKRVKAAIAEIMFEKNFKKRNLKWTFDKWKVFASLKKTKKLKRAVADQYFKNNLKVKRIRVYFERLKIFTQNRKALKLKMDESCRYYKKKLKGRVFNAFFSYITHRRLRKNQIERVSQLHFNKLKQKMFNKLVSYRMYKSFQRDRYKFANNFYEKKLLAWALHSFWKNLQRQLYEKKLLEALTEQRCKRLKNDHFNCWKIYVFNKKTEIQKYSMATVLYESRCKKKYLRKWKLYRLYRKNKIQYQTMKLHQIKCIFERRVLIICFNSWRYFTYNKKIKKEQLQLAQMNYESILKKFYFQLWLRYKKYKKMKKRRIIEVHLFYYHKTLQTSFNIWKHFTCEKRMFMLKKIESKKYYQQCVVRYTFKLMIQSAFQEKDYKLDNFLENEKRRLTLAQKYIRVWKNKMKKCVMRKFYYKEIDFNSNTRRSCVIEQKRDSLLNSFIESLPETFIWDPICFARPRIPDYMKKYYQHS